MNEKEIDTPIRLTAQVACAGCASKLPPGLLASILADIPRSKHPDLLVGYDTSDDAGVFRINETQALVQTVDFFPPIVDDPYWFGRIAAANALSDVYAMGGKPLTALNLVGFPIEMPTSILKEILRGGYDTAAAANVTILGGHSIKDKELKFGMSVTGIINPQKIFTNATAKVGDLLYLTKPLGTGIITTGIKRGKVTQETTDAVTKQMATLNDRASALMIEHSAHAATDVTGFGLMGHSYEMANGSNVTIRYFSDRLPLLPAALELAKQNIVTGGATDNREFVSSNVQINPSIPAHVQHLLFDPQTSGGLLIAISPEKSNSFSNALKAAGLPHQSIGVVEAASEVRVIVE